jgi:hypothetical protein
MKKELLALASLILIIVGFSGCIDLGNNSSGPEVRSYFEDEYDASDDTILSVSTVNGGISISSWDGYKIFLNATKKSRNGEDDLDKAEIVVTEDGNKINIEILHAQPIDSRAVDLDIKIPYNVSVETVISINGGIFVENVEGYLTATTTNGGIVIKNTTGIDNIISTNGGIIAEIFDIQKDVDIQSTNGGITLKIKSTLNSSIQISTTNGEITVGDDFISVSESSYNSFKGTIGSGGNTINILTTNGGITINELEV